MTVAVLGEALIDLIAGEGGAFRPHLGGSPYNVAIGLARQGIPVSYLSPLSDDTFGDRLHASLTSEGVRTPVERRSPRPTSLALVVIDDTGVPAYRLYREGIADKDISLEEIDDHLPDGLEVFHTGSLAITPSQLDKIRAVLGRVRDRGVSVSIDVNIRLGASLDTEAYLRGVRSLLPLADIVKASEEDLEALSIGPDLLTSAQSAREQMGQGLFMLTRGRSGACLYTAHGVIEREACSVDHVVDTVGAGDVFHSAFLASLLKQRAIVHPAGEIGPGALAAAMNFACAAAAINVSRSGCSPPTSAEVEEFARIAPS